MVMTLPIFVILSASNQINEIPSEESSEDSKICRVYKLRENPVGIEMLKQLTNKAQLWIQYKKLWYIINL